MYDFLGFFWPVLRIIVFQSHRLLSLMTVIETMDSSDRGINPATMTIINSRKEYWPNRGSNQRPPVLNSCMPTTQLDAFSLANERKGSISNVNLWCLTHPNRQLLDSSKLRRFANDNFKSDENGRKFFRRVENTAGKGEIARYEQFLLFPQCFLKTCTADT